MTAAGGIINRSNTHFRFVVVAAAHLSTAAPVRDLGGAEERGGQRPACQLAWVGM